MKKIAYLTIAISILLLLVGVSMDVTVGTASGARVYNIGLMNERTNFFILGGLGLIGGLIISATAKKNAVVEPGSVPESGWVVKLSIRKQEDYSAAVEKLEKLELPFQEIGECQINVGPYHSSSEARKVMSMLGVRHYLHGKIGWI